MSRRLAVLVSAAALAFAIACGGGSEVPSSDILDLGSHDGTEAEDVAGDPGLDGTGELDGVTEVAEAPSLELAFVTASGLKGQGVADVNLAKADEPAAYSGTVGFQVDVQVTTTHLENGANVTLSIAGSKVATAKAQVDATGKGTALFQGVTLTQSIAGYEVAANATNVAGLTGTATKTVHVDIGTCEVDVSPKNTACLLNDADPTQAGVQLVFTVSNPDRTCNTAKLTYTIDGKATTTAPVAIGASGSVQISVTVSDTATGIADLQVMVQAEVSDSASADRTAESAAVTYTVDLVGPTLTLTQPQAGTLTVLNDKDGNLSNGLTIDVVGTQKGIAPGASVTLSVNGTASGNLAPASDGSFLFADVALTINGKYTLAVSGKDSCGRTGQATVDVIAVVTQAAYAFLSPQPGSTLFAKSDGNPSTASLYETQFEILAQSVAIGTTLTLRCRQNQFGSTPVTIGSLKIDTLSGNATYVIPATLDVTVLTSKVLCQVLDDAVNRGESSEVPLTIGLPAPGLVIVAPKAGTAVKQATLPVGVSATGLADVTPSVQISDSTGTVLVTFTPPAPFGTDGASWTVPLSNGGVALPDGVYTLRVDATDAFGNVASDIAANVTTVQFTLDTTAPVVAIVTPDHDTLDPVANAADADQDPSGQPGYQTTLVVNVVSGGDGGTTVCITVNGDGATCTSTLGQAQFAGTTLQPGANVITAWATDAAGNKGPVVQRTLTLVSNAPRVTITVPAKDGPVAAVPFPMTVNVTDASQVPLAGASVALLVSGNPVWGTPQTTDAQGNTTFQITTLSEGGDHFFARGTVGGVDGYSAPRLLNLKTTAPEITFQTLQDGAYVNRAFAACSPGVQDCVLDVVLATSNVEPGSVGSLTVVCGTGNPVVVSGEAIGDLLTFPGVTLKDQGPCTLTATVTDLGGQVGTAGPIHVTVDRIPPKLVGFAAPAPTLSGLISSSDEDPATPGLQYTVRVLASGLESGTTATLSYGLLGGTLQTTSVGLTQSIPDWSIVAIAFPPVTLTDGNTTLGVTLTDAAGNPVTGSRLILVWGNQPLVSIGSPAFVADKTCTASSQCGAGGFCGDGRCAIPWTLTGNRSLRVAIAQVPTGPQNVRVCSDTAGLTGAPCNSATFHTVAVTTVAADGAFAEIPLANLADGHYHLVAEAKVTDGTPWASSIDSPIASERERFVFQDTVLPTVTLLASPSDANGDGLLGALEAAVPGTRTFSLHATGSEPGQATLYVDGVAVAHEDAFTGDWTTQVTLNEGSNELYVVLQDGVGNPSPVPPDPAVVYYRPTVDTTPPTLSFVKPSSGVVRAGDTQDVVLTSDAIGLAATLQEKVGGAYGDAITASVQADGSASFPGFLANEGNHEIRAQVSDLAGNVASVELTVFVDTGVPLVALNQPPATGIEILADANDAQPGTPGFQVEVNFGSPSVDAVSWEIWLAQDCDAGFVTCDPPVLIKAGAITAPGGTEPSVFPTIDVAATPYYLFMVKVFDGVGNVASQLGRVQINLVSCQVGVTGVTSGTWINTQKCGTPGQNCASAQVPITVNVTAACGAVDTLKLLVAGTPVAGTMAGASAQFNPTFQDGTAPTLEGQAFVGAGQVGTSGVLSLSVDLTNPAVAFTTPAAGSNTVFGQKADNSPAPDLQTTLHATYSDANLAGGRVNAVTYDPGTGPVSLSPSNVTLPLSLVAGSGGTDLAVILADQTKGAVTVLVQDVAGNIGTSTFNATVDLIPPAAIALTSPTAPDINPRRPAVTLHWTAVGDNGTTAGTKAASYDVRYSTLAIATTSDFERACKVNGLAYTAALPAPAVAGTAQSFTVTGPDLRAPAVQENGQPCKLVTGSSGLAGYNFAVRAVDAAGNPGAISSASVVPVDFGFRFANVSGTVAPWNNVNFERRVFAVGDLNDDGKSDLGIGGSDSNAFCIVYGHSTSATDPTIADLAISTATGPHHQCLSGPTGGRLGTPVAYAGDVNGDGVDDLVVGDGTVGAQTVYIHFGVKNGVLSTTPNVTIKGSNPGIGRTVVAGGGDFNHDGLKDLVIGSRAGNLAHVVPGDATWTAATKVTIDLSVAADRTAHKVVTLSMVKNPSPTWTLTQFGANVAFVKDVNGDGYDEVAVSVNGTGGVLNPDPTQIVVFEGRAVPAAMTLSVSQSSDGTGADDATSCRLAADASNAPQFGVNALSGLYDLDGDGKGDVVASHSPNLFASPSTTKSIYGFSGSAIAAQFGKPGFLTHSAPIPPPTGGVQADSKGFVIYGSYDYPAVVGDLDDESTSAANPSYDLSYAMFSSTTTYGKLFLRFNLADPAGSFAHGTFPWESPVLVDPLDPAGTKFGYTGAVDIGDFNGDGFADLLIGTNGAGYATIFY